MKTVGYAIVGTGYFGAELGRIMKEQEGAKIVAVLDPENGQTIADELGCDVETDLDTLYSRDDVDAVIVATPNYLHKEPVVKAAEHGVNVFCEKPIALSYQDCDDMVRACQEHGVIFMAGHVMNFFHGVRHAKKLINDGVIGKVLYCHSARNGWEEQQPTISWKKIREKSGGHLYHHIHELDCVQFLMGGMPEEVTMTGGNVAHQGEAFGDEDDMLFVNMQFSDNRYAVLEWGSAFHWPEHYVLIQGTKGATTSYGTQLSVINYSQPIDGKPAIILSAPNATNGRKNGKIWIGLINETGQSGVNKYSVEWKYCYSVDTPQMGYSYSCLTELPDGKVGLLYEKYDSWSRNELHLKNILKYEKFTIDELKVQP